MSVSNEFLYKPVSESNGNLVVLTPNMYNDRINQVELVDSQGNIVEQGSFAGNEHNGQRGHFRFNQPGAGYGNDFSVRVSFDDGTDPLSIPISQGGGRYTQNYSSAGGAELNYERGNGQSSGTRPVYDDAGNLVATAPGQVDYGQITPSQIDYQQQLGLAQQYGELAAQQYYGNLARSQGSALGIVGTDIAGLEFGLNTLGQRSRSEGRADLQENIQRASELDQFNFSRLSGVNAFNRQMAEQANEFNQAQMQDAQDATGIGYRNRISEILDRLEQRSETGRMGEEFDAAMDTAIASQASDLLGSSGVSAVSGAGVRARDRAMIQERMNLALGAESQYINTLSATQQQLQFQPERAPTAYAQPTQVPLNPASVEARMPITSGISAGQAQMQIAGQATQLQAIPATGVLSSALSTAQFNEQARYNHEVLTADRQQDYNNMMANIGQGVINQDYAAQMRDEQYNAYQQGMDVRERADTWGGVATVGGMGLGYLMGGGSAPTTSTPAATTAPGGGAAAPAGGATATAAPAEAPGFWESAGGYVDDAVTGASEWVSDTWDSVTGSATTKSAGGSARVSRGANGKSATGNTAVDSIMNSPNDTAGFVGSSYDTTKRTANPRGKAAVGNREVSGQEYNDAMNRFQKTVDGTPENYANTSTGYSTLDAQATEQAMTKGAGPAKQPKEAPSLLEQAEAGYRGARDFIRESTQPLRDQGIDGEVLRESTNTLMNWGAMPQHQQLHNVGNISTQILENRGIIPSEEARAIQEGIDAVSTLANPNSTTAQRGSALGVFTAEAMTTSFTGDIDNPTTIGGVGVIGAGVDAQGNTAFQLEDGSTISQSTLQNTAYVMAGANALQTVFSDTSDENKILALTEIGVGPARAADIVTQTQAGNTLAALSVLDTTMNWADRTPIQRGISLMRTGSTVYNQLSNLGTSQATAQATNSVLQHGTSAAAPGTGATTAATTGIDVGGTLASGAQVVAGAYGMYKGVEQAATVIEAADDMAQSQAVGYASGGLATAGAGILGGAAGIATGLGVGAGAAAAAGVGTAMLPVVGTIIGAAVGAVAGVIVGSTGTGKNTGQLMRDGWRDGMLESGFANKDSEGNVAVTLADGSNYNIGLDGGAKLTNKDGSERQTFDIDWSDPTATETIPDAHLMAIATGLDPTGAEGHGLFDRATGQIVNAATSNTDSVDGARSNYKAMIENSGVNPVDLGMRVETLRATNKITDQEYGVYIDRINQMFGTKFQPADTEASRQSLVKMIDSKPVDQRSDYDKQLYKELTDQKTITSSSAALKKRLAKGEAAKKGEKYRSEREVGILAALGKLPKDNTKDLMLYA